MSWEFGVSRYKALHTVWINNRAPLDSTGNYIQYPVINHMVKNMKKKIYISTGLVKKFVRVFL